MLNVYKRFIVKSSLSVFAESLVDMEHFISDCELSRLMQELIGNYIMMEEYFMREMVVKVLNDNFHCWYHGHFFA